LITAQEIAGLNPAEVTKNEGVTLVLMPL